MKSILAALLLTVTFIAFAAPQGSNDNIVVISDQYGNAVTCNWGELTSTVIVEDGFDQGGHASSFPTPRVGLANVVARGDMQALCTLLSGAL
jgi:hypothetical protein